VPAGAAERVRTALAAGGTARLSGMLHVGGAAGTTASTFAWPAP
jgi:hypothetical protein